ncbi:MAG: hypothetical protein IT347_11525 [Candidatus Eisenbacteria bacterium]|nr:hypothetical protein [Candidatus Eisenbacteria bacterium]
MADSVAFDHAPEPPLVRRFGAGLSEAEVRRFQTILERECGVSLSLPEAWGRAIALLALVEMLLQGHGAMPAAGESFAEFAHPRS